jgi:hypothetical protein
MRGLPPEGPLSDFWHMAENFSGATTSVAIRERETCRARRLRTLFAPLSRPDDLARYEDGVRKRDCRSNGEHQLWPRPRLLHHASGRQLLPIPASLPLHRK